MRCVELDVFDVGRTDFGDGLVAPEQRAMGLMRQKSSTRGWVSIARRPSRLSQNYNSYYKLQFFPHFTCCGRGIWQPKRVIA
jgi:hypothetical protein